jgi:hypothetical protein
MHKVLSERHAFSETRLRLDALAKNIFLEDLDWLLTVEPGESDPTRLLFYAGHGALIKDINGNEEDKFDEVLCMPDYTWRDPGTYINDDELGARLNIFTGSHPTAFLVCIHDCCHSGTGTRNDQLYEGWDEIHERMLNDEVKVPLDLISEPLEAVIYSKARDIPPSMDLREEEPRNVLDGLMTEDLANTVKPKTRFIARGLTRGFSGGNDMGHLLLAACSSYQKAKECELEGGHHGMFSHTLLRVVSEGGDLSYENLHRAISERFSPEVEQAPQLEGPEALRARPIFT